MIQHTEQSLLQEGYTIKNVYIKDVDFTMANYGCLMLYLDLTGENFSVSYGGYALGKGRIGGDEFIGSPNGIEYIMRIMDTLGIERFQNIKGAFARIAFKNTNEPIKIIGNVLTDKWFDIDNFLAPKVEIPYNIEEENESAQS